jgi:hypothetical protein
MTILCLRWIKGRPAAFRPSCYGQSSPTIHAGFGRALMPHLLKRTQDLSHDLPPTDEGKGETGAESDRYLGNPTVTHQTVLIRYPAGTMTGSRQKSAAGMKTIGLRNRASHFTAKRRSAIHAVFAAQHGAPSTGTASLRQQ